MFNKIIESILFIAFKLILIGIAFFFWFYIVGLIDKRFGAVVGLIAGIFMLLLMTRRRTPY